MRLFLSSLIILTIILISGCSSDAPEPITPSATNDGFNLPVTQFDENNTNRQYWGSWTAAFNLDDLTCDVSRNRDLNAHFNIKSMIPAPSIAVNSYDLLTEIIDVDVTIFNPFALDAYDVRLIIHTDGVGHNLINGDNWTDLFDGPEGLTINPFTAYAKTAPSRIFTALSEHTENLRVVLPNGNSNVSFAIDASYPGSCTEPYSIRNFAQETLLEIPDSEAEVTVEVYDWQFDIDSVSLYCPEITGQTLVDFTEVSTNEYSLNLVNATGAIYGEYTGVILANSGGGTLYEMLTITVTPDNVAEWTYLTYIHETYGVENAINIDLNEMEVVGSVEGLLNIVALYDRKNTADDWIIEIEKDPNGFNGYLISPHIDDGGAVIPPGGLDMGNGETMEKFLRWAMENYPAENYAITTIAHGDGPFGVEPEPIEFFKVCGGLSMWEIRDACQTVLDEHPDMDKIAMIGFNSCLMSYIETGYVLKDVCEVCVASEMVIPLNPDLPYHLFLQYLLDNISTCTPVELGAEIVATYMSEVSSYGDGYTLATWESDKIDLNAIPALNAFADELILALPDYKTLILNCSYQTGSWGGGWPFCNEYWVKDIGVFAEVVNETASLPQSLRDAAYDLVASIEETMIIHDHSGTGGATCPYGETGWQIWFPTNYSNSEWSSHRADYASLGFTDTSWDDFLNALDD